MPRTNRKFPIWNHFSVENADVQRLLPENAQKLLIIKANLLKY